MEIDHAGRSLKAQFKYADKVGAANVLTIGEDELAKGTAVVKSMTGGAPQEVALEAEDILKGLRGE